MSSTVCNCITGLFVAGGLIIATYSPMAHAQNPTGGATPPGVGSDQPSRIFPTRIAPSRTSSRCRRAGRWGRRTRSMWTRRAISGSSSDAVSIRVPSQRSIRSCSSIPLANSFAASAPASSCSHTGSSSIATATCGSSTPVSSKASRAARSSSTRQTAACCWNSASQVSAAQTALAISSTSRRTSLSRRTATCTLRMVTSTRHRTAGSST